MSHIDRATHLANCKRLAMEKAGKGDYSGAVQDFFGDLGRGPETKNLAIPIKYTAGRECKDMPSFEAWLATFE